MFQAAPGNKIPYPERIAEQYQVFDQCVRANISYEKLRPIIDELVALLPEPLFLALELPLNQNEEKELEGDDLHKEVLYLDGQTRADMVSLLETYGSVLLADGVSQFAVASHQSREEIYVQKYKLTDIFAEDPSRFTELLEKHGLTKTEKLETVWDTFSRESPGMCSMVAIDGLDIYGIAEALKKEGMYRAKIVED